MSDDTDFMDRKDLARYLLEKDMEEVDFELQPNLDLLPPAGTLTRDLELGNKFPAGLAPVPAQMNAPSPSDRLPNADVLVVTWTVAEQNALADVLTPNFGRNTWFRYNRRFAQHYNDLIRPGAPAKRAERLGSWRPTDIGGKSVICFKSELHLNQDGITDFNGPGYASLPVHDMFEQLIDEVQPSLVITVGTSGGVYRQHDLGDVVVTRGAKFRLHQEFSGAPFNNQSYRSDWQIDTQHFAKSVELMESFQEELQESPILPPTVRHTGDPYGAPTYRPDIKLDGTGGMPAFHPILTTDYFEYGTSTNNLEQEGCAVEMGDAVLGLVCQEMGNNAPRWVVVRNLSDPQINGELPRKQATFWAVYYYEEYGYWTSVMSALAAWAIIAGN